MGALAPFLASIILGFIALVYFALTARAYLRAGSLEIKHKVWLRTAIIFTVIAVGVAILNLVMGA